MSFIVVMSARRRGVGQQRHLAAVLHSYRDVTLVLAAVAADAAGTDLAAVGDELRQQGRVLVVDVGRLVLAELADLLLGLANRGLGHRVLQIQRGSGKKGSEGGLVGRPGGRRPGVARAATATATEATTTAAAEAAAALTARGAGDLGRGIAQRGTDLVDLELDDGALLAFLRLERTLLEPAADDDPRSAGERLGHVLGRLPPNVAAEEQRLAVLPLLRLTVEGAGGRCDREVGDGSARRREAQLRIGGQVADHGDDGFAGHGQWTSGRISLVRSTDSFRLSCRSSSATAAGSAWMSTTA